MRNIIVTGIEHVEHTGDLGGRQGHFKLSLAGENLKFTDENGVELSLEPKKV